MDLKELSDLIVEIEKKYLIEKNSHIVQAFALNHVFEVTETTEGCEIVAKSSIIENLLSILQKKESLTSKVIHKILVNLSSVAAGCSNIIRMTERNFLSLLLNTIVNPNENSENAIKILCNLTRLESNLNILMSRLEPLEPELLSLRDAFSRTNQDGFDMKTMDYIAMLFCNFSVHSKFRGCILNSSNDILLSVLPYIHYKDSDIRRAGIVGMLKNCCFDSDTHEALLKEKDILPYILLPLAGGEDISEEETEKLPLELQYLETTKEREAKENIRLDLLETLYKLCTTKSGREYVRDSNTYVILREYYKWETSKQLLLVADDLINVLIRTEDEIGRSDLENGVIIPENVPAKLKEMDDSFLND